MNFTNNGPTYAVDFPVSIKVAAGKINAVTGERWTRGLNADPQDYMVSPEQPWLDGFAVEKGVIRQFVAMPLGEGFSVEGQMTGREEWGGLQISVTPLKAQAWQRYKREKQNASFGGMVAEAPANFIHPSGIGSMGLGAGGRMRQIIYPDPFEIDDWDVAATERVFVTLVDAKDWKAVTGEAAHNQPPTAQDYARAGLPWFEHYGNDQAALPGRGPLQHVKSVATIFHQKTGTVLPNSEDVTPGPIHKLGPGSDRPRAVRSTEAWE